MISASHFAAKYSFTAFVSRNMTQIKVAFGSYLFIFDSLLPQLLINRIMTTRLVQSHVPAGAFENKNATYTLLSGSPLVVRSLLN